MALGAQGLEVGLKIRATSGERDNVINLASPYAEEAAAMIALASTLFVE